MRYHLYHKLKSGRTEAIAVTAEEQVDVVTVNIEDSCNEEITVEEIVEDESIEIESNIVNTTEEGFQYNDKQSEEWIDKINRYRISGLPLFEWCKLNSVSEGSMRYHLYNKKFIINNNLMDSNLCCIIKD